MFNLFKKKEVPVEVPKPKYRIAHKIIELRVYADDGVVEKIINQGIKLDYLDPYDGMSASEIKELEERVYQVSDDVNDYRLEEKDDKLNLYVKDYKDKEYFIADISSYKNVKYYLKNKDNYDIDIQVKYGGGKYKVYSGGSVITDFIPPYIYVCITMYNRGE